MRVTRDNATSLIEQIEELSDLLETLKDAAETWNDLQDNDSKTADDREEIREAREAFDTALDDAMAPLASLNRLVNGKHTADS